jgi:hypothetical protein
MRHLRTITFLGFLTAFLPSGGASAAEEFFAGPFPSWKNVKADYGAMGDGKADDTAAIQKALDDLRLHKNFCVLYFPAGTYRVTDTVKTVRKEHEDCMGVAVLGENPATTTLRWDGKKDGILFQYDAWYSRIGRLTLDGNGKAAACLAYGPTFSTNNETADLVFKNATIGLFLGVPGAGQAENAVLRCRFSHCGTGVRTVDFNSMDIWVWHCRFEDCGHGLFNAAGNFHAYYNLFLRSKKADIGTNNLMVFSFVGNSSYGSQCFLDFSGGHTWGSPTSITGNRIFDPQGNVAIRLGNGGPYLVMDNVIRSRPGQAGPVVQMTWGDQAFVGNTYTVAGAVQEEGRSLRIDEKVVAAKGLDSRMPVLPETPPRREGKVIEVPAGSSADAIQKAIDAAAEFRGRQPVVHLPKGTYRIDRTLVVPAGLDVWIVGDGGATTATALQWAGPAGGVLLKLQGPSRAALSDFCLTAPASARCLLVEDCDQPGGRILADQLVATGLTPERKCKTALRIDGVERATLLFRCVQGGGNSSETFVEVIGDPERRTGANGPGRPAILTGAGGTSDTQYTVTKGGRLLVRGFYHEKDGSSARAIRLSDSGSLAIDSTRFTYQTSDKEPLIELDGFRGDFALTASVLTAVESSPPGRLELRGKGDGCKALCLATQFWVNEAGVNTGKVWRNETTPPAAAAMALCNINTATKGATPNGFDRLENNGKASKEFVHQMLQPLRDSPAWPAEGVKEGATDVRLHRVMATAGKGGTAVELRGGK